MTPTLVRISFAPLTCDVKSVALHLRTTSRCGIKFAHLFRCDTRRQEQAHFIPNDTSLQFFDLSDKSHGPCSTSDLCVQRTDWASDHSHSHFHTFVGEDGTRESCNWHSQSADCQQLMSGTWRCPGLYHMLPDQPTKKFSNVFRKVSVSLGLASSFRRVRCVSLDGFPRLQVVGSWSNVSNLVEEASGGEMYSE